MLFFLDCGNTRALLDWALFFLVPFFWMVCRNYYWVAGALLLALLACSIPILWQTIAKEVLFIGEQVVVVFGISAGLDIWCLICR